MHPEVMLLLAHEHQAELARSAAWESQIERAAAPRPDRDRADDARPAPRLDRAPDRAALEPLFELNV
jgi:hypothetical protein